MSKLGLGTVQFGQAYGVSNAGGQVPADEAAAILQRAARAGVMLLDTAANYGAAESVLAQLNTAPFRIVTKTIGISNGLDAVIARAKASAQNLKADTLLVHAAGDLADETLWPALQRLKQDGVFRRIGISTYVADSPTALAARFNPDVMQLPFSLLDQRLLADGTLDAACGDGRGNPCPLVVPARAALDGKRAAKNSAAQRAHLKQIRTAITAAGSTPLAAALGFVLSRPEITIGLVGVTSLAELDEILAATKQPLPDLDWPSLVLHDERVLTPSLW